MLVGGMALGRAAAQRQAEMQQQAYQQGQNSQSEIATPKVDMTAELQKLAALHGSGALSDEEFATAKKKLLG